MDILHRSFRHYIILNEMRDDVNEIVLEYLLCGVVHAVETRRGDRTKGWIVEQRDRGIKRKTDVPFLGNNGRFFQRAKGRYLVDPVIEDDRIDLVSQKEIGFLFKIPVLIAEAAEHEGTDEPLLLANSIRLVWEISKLLRDNNTLFDVESETTDSLRRWLPRDYHIEGQRRLEGDRRNKDGTGLKGFDRQSDGTWFNGRGIPNG